MMLDFIMPVEAISLQELQLSSQFELVYSCVYPKNSPIDEPNGHRRINATVYVLMPALDYIAGVQLQYDYELNRYLRQMLGDYDKPRTKRIHALDIFCGVSNKKIWVLSVVFMVPVCILFLMKAARDGFILIIYLP